MIPALLITFREVIEATLIVATILGILTRLKKTESIRNVWYGAAAAAILSVILLIGASILGLKIQELYVGRIEEIIEGTLQIISALFITWAVFWLHRYFGKHKLELLQQVKSTISDAGSSGLFILTFTAVFREGFEIVLFLSTIFLSERPLPILGGFSMGLLGGLALSVLLYTATIRFPIYRTFQITTVLLILFAAGLLARGVHEFAEAGFVPEFQTVIIHVLPENSFAADTIKALFGVSRKMDSAQLVMYASYIAFMRWYIYGRKKTIASQV